MRFAVCLAALATLTAVCLAEDAKHSPPKVQVYSHVPGQYGKENVLICHVSGFYPPNISIKLTENGHELPHSKQTDLAFKQGWRFHLTKHVHFTPMDGHKYNCEVTHGQSSKGYAWESNM